MNNTGQSIGEYASCPFCGSDDVGPTYWVHEYNGKRYYIAAIGCTSCAAHGPVRNDYPQYPAIDGEKADEVENWIAAAWNRMPAISKESALMMDARLAPDNG